MFDLRLIESLVGSLVRNWFVLDWNVRLCLVQISSKLWTVVCLGLAESSTCAQFEFN